MRPTVLFVDDEPKILNTLKRMFHRDCDVLTADGGEGAVEILGRESVDVIVCDQRMPGMTGIDVLRQAKKLSPRTTRIVLTGYADLDAAIRAVNEGEVYRYVNKPWSNEELIVTVLAAAKQAFEHGFADPAEKVNDDPDREGKLLSLVDCGVLIMDKDRDLLNTILFGLGDQASLYTADTPENALQIMKAQDVGVLIADTDIGGEEITSAIFKIKEHYPDLVVMIVTYRADVVHVVELINSGHIFRFIPKPTSFNVLLPNIEAAIEAFSHTPSGILIKEKHEENDDSEWLP